jgi:predicted nucleic acid-binding protein
MKTLVDANVILDVVTDDPKWRAWSEHALRDAAENSALVVNPIIFAEVSVGFVRIEEVHQVLENFSLEPLPDEAGFLAGKAFFSYRKKGGLRRSPMPDFYVGAHAAVCGMQLLTRDAARYRSYFPRLTVIAPRLH